MCLQGGGDVSFVNCALWNKLVELVAVPCAVEGSVVKISLVIVVVVLSASHCSRSCTSFPVNFMIAQDALAATAGILREKEKGCLLAINYVQVYLESETAFEMLLLVVAYCDGTKVRVPVHVLRLFLLLEVHF